MQKKRLKITIINHYNVLETPGGGSIVIMEFYKALSALFDVRLILLSEKDIFKNRILVNDCFEVVNIPLNDKLCAKLKDFYSEYGMNASTVVDITPFILMYVHEDEDMMSQLLRETLDSDILVAEHVYTWNIIKKILNCSTDKKTVWYRSQNIEYKYKKYLWEKLSNTSSLLSVVHDAECECVTKSDLVLSISSEECDQFKELYNLSDAKNIYNLSVGYECENIKPKYPSDRHIDGSQFIKGFFISLDTPGARRIVQNCIDVARKLCDVQFIIAGSVGKSFSEIDIPKNVIITGIISDEQKIDYLMNCDFAINTIDSGNGVNIKMLEFFAYGIPVIASNYGTRGLEIKEGIHFVHSEMEDFCENILRFRDLTLSKKDEIANNANVLLHEKYNWKIIAERLAENVYKSFGLSYNYIELKEIHYNDKRSSIEFERNRFYIRCFGDWGKSCYRYFKSKGVDIVGVIDNSNKYFEIAGDKISTITCSDFFINYNDEIVVVAIDNYKNIVEDLIANGVKKNNIWIYRSGNILFPLANPEAYLPFYIDANKV